MILRAPLCALKLNSLLIDCELWTKTSRKAIYISRHFDKMSVSKSYLCSYRATFSNDFKMGIPMVPGPSMLYSEASMDVDRQKVCNWVWNRGSM